MRTADPATRDRWLNGLASVDTRPWYRRLLRSPLFWMTVLLIPAYAYCLYAQYGMLAPAQEFEDGSMTLGISNEAFRKAAFSAMWTALAYSLLFVWLDRFRASSPVVWVLTFAWGACASTWFSIHVNSWAGEMMATRAANSDAGSRAAIFSAPFVEEFSKATILVLLVLLWRNKMVSRLSMVALAGLSAVGFAFVENIIYYARVWMQATHDITIADPDATMHELVLLRGVYTSFGHPLFTMMTASGLVIGLGARSKIVRVLAPVGGFLVACAGHMLFNGLSSTNSVDALMGPYYMALGVVAIIVVSLVISVIGNGQLIRTRLADYQRAGWLTERQVELYGRPLRRVKLIWYAMLRGPRAWWQTTRLLRRVTELAYLRNQMTRGTVAGPGDDRARELIHLIHQPGPRALLDYQGLPMLPPRRRRKRLAPPPPGQSAGPLTTQYPPPQAPGPAGVGGNWPVRR
ncbi:MAG: PrsW family intramembrane metalloprotease [Arachnia sp.]